jgi:hypothetical protein
MIFHILRALRSIIFVMQLQYTLFRINSYLRTVLTLIYESQDLHMTLLHKQKHIVKRNSHREYQLKTTEFPQAKNFQGFYFCFSIGRVETIITFYYQRYRNIFILLNISYNKTESCINIKWNKETLLHHVNYHSRW